MTHGSSLVEGREALARCGDGSVWCSRWASRSVEKPIGRRGEAHRATWRSLSRSENARIIHPTHYQRHRQEKFSGFAPLVRLHLAERLQVNLHLARWHELCSTLQNFAFRRGAKNKCRTFATEIRLLDNYYIISSLFVLGNSSDNLSFGVRRGMKN